VRALPGQRILALSNLYGIATGDEAVSVLQGVITAMAPLKARRGAYQANFRGEVYVLDAYANNPGAAGGALVDAQGRLLGVLGKELRSEVTGTWLNYALPIPQIATTIDDLLAGRVDDTPLELPEPEDALTMEKLGFSLVPDVLPRTPPYIDALRRESPAQRAGLQPDDLVVFVGGEPIDSHRSVVERLGKIESFEPVTISVLRDSQLREFSLVVPAAVADEPADVTNETDSDGQDS
jgi:serine protease Do